MPEDKEIQGITGEIEEVKVGVPANGNLAGSVAIPSEKDIDLKRMAQWAMNYLIRTPRAHLNYEPVFSAIR